MDRTLPCEGRNAGSIPAGGTKIMRPTHASGDYIFVAHGRNRKRAQGPVQQNGSREQGRAEKSLDEDLLSAWPNFLPGAQNR